MAATPGFSLQYAIAEIAKVVDLEPPTGTVGDSDTDDYGKIRDMIEEEATAQLSRGWADNTDRAVTVTVAGGVGVAAGASDALYLRSVSPYRKLSLRAGAIQDQSNNTLAADGDYVVDIVRNIDFEEVPQTLKNVIVAHAKLKALDHFTPGDAERRKATVYKDVQLYEQAAGQPMIGGMTPMPERDG